jgi:outer membrane translocation and assembly module TamA
MELANLEYALGNRDGLRVIGFYDVGRATFRASPTNPDWMNGVGFGIGMGDLRLDFGYKLHDIPSSFQFLMRFVRTF